MKLDFYEIFGEIREKTKLPSMRFLYANSLCDPETMSDEDLFLDSYMGFKPYIMQDDVWPTCQQCSAEMNFFMQINEIKEKYSELKTYYHCNCSMIDKVPAPSIAVLSYTDPDIDLLDKNKHEGRIFYKKVDIFFDPCWSVPAWKLLKNFDPSISNIHFINNSEFTPGELFEELRIRYDLVGVGLDAYNHFGGYPEFVGNVIDIKCDCCDTSPEFYFQIRPTKDDDMFEFDFNNAILYCYMCKKSKKMFFFLN